ncbi:MAG: hypothetical protein DRI79_10450 [Chloroflexi bacterium]|nr:MAG: hypothetical protein DRI79_10450 [Chloroflexota bacterium]
MFRKVKYLVVALQILLLCLGAVIAISNTIGCSSSSGSDYEYGSRSIRSPQNPAVLQRFHDLSFDFPLQFSAKDFKYARAWLPGNWVLGLQVPQAPGAAQPGDVTGNPELWGHWDEQRGDDYDLEVTVPLALSDDWAAKITAALPPDPNTHWQALVPANDDYINSIPTDDRTFVDGWGVLFYALDFHGENLCNGCEVKMTLCTPCPSPLFGRPVACSMLRGLARLGLLGRLSLHSAGGLTCVEPVPSTIVLIGAWPPIIVPGSTPAAWLSPWGGPFYNQVYGPTVVMSYTLGHNAPQTTTFNLEPIYSEQGWTYSWHDPDGNPISQMTVGPNVIWDENIKVVGTGLPTCAVIQDTVHLTATSTTSPSLQATTVSYVQVVPDPDQCETADLGLAKVSSTDVISAGQWVTFTLTITNYENVAVSAILTDTIHPASAVGDLILPSECGRSGDDIICQLPLIQANSATTLTIAVQASWAFSGTMTNQAVVNPVGMVDGDFYDNFNCPINIQVRGVPNANLALGKVAARNSVIAGERITYTLIITNGGPTAPITATIVDTFGDPTALASVASDGDCAWTPGSAVVTCTVPDVSVNAPVSITLVVTTGVTYSGLLTNTAVVTPTGGLKDFAPDDNQAGPVKVTVYAPVVAGFLAAPTEGIAPLTVVFTNTSTGDYTTSLWDFGDGVTSTLESPTHTYTTPGVYTITLTVGGPGGEDTETRTDYITVHAPVVAGFVASPTEGVAPLTVVFTNTSTGDYTASLWDFGDGVTSTLESPTHTYTTPGVYTVTLMVEGPGGEDTETRTDYITVYAPVVAGFIAAPTEGIAPLTVVFTNTSTGDYTASLWDFGDGVTSTLESPTHTYTTPGVYTVTLTVEGPGGTAMETKAEYVSVWYSVYLPLVMQSSGAVAQAPPSSSRCILRRSLAPYP